MLATNPGSATCQEWVDEAKPVLADARKDLEEDVEEDIDEEVEGTKDVEASGDAKDVGMGEASQSTAVSPSLPGLGTDVPYSCNSAALQC